MVDMFLFSVCLSTADPKQPERVNFVASSVSEVFGIVAHNDEYVRRFVSIDLVTEVKTI